MEMKKRRVYLKILRLVGLIFPLVVLSACFGHEAIKPWPKHVSLEMRLIKETGDLTHRTRSVWKEKIFYLHDSVDFSEVDVKGFRVEKGPHGQDQFFLEFHEPSAQALATFTAENTQKRMGILINGKIVSAPVIMQPILGGQLVISFGNEKSPELLKILK